MTTTTSNKALYHVMSIDDAPKPAREWNRQRHSPIVEALKVLRPNTVAEFAPCASKHGGPKQRSCSGGVNVTTYARRHGIQVRTWHVNGNLYVARLA